MFQVITTNEQVINILDNAIIAVQAGMDFVLLGPDTQREHHHADILECQGVTYIKNPTTGEAVFVQEA